MVESKGWDWKIVVDDDEHYWKNPSPESYYCLYRWASQGKKDFLDLGCGLGRHSMLFGRNGFNVSSIDISEEAVKQTREWAESEGLKFDYKIGDMLKLPYEDNQFDCIYCLNVISHTDTEGVKKAIKELERILRKGGECYLTLCSKETWGFKQDWPRVDENTKLRMDEGPEYKVPHFYADYDSVKELFVDFNIINVNQIIHYYEKDGRLNESYHYHILIQK